MAGRSLTCPAFNASLERARAAEARQKAAIMCRRPGVLTLLVTIVRASRASTRWPGGTREQQTRVVAWVRLSLQEDSGSAKHY